MTDPIKNIIVMGHSGCGGIKNGFHMCKDNEFETSSSAVPKWLQILKPAYETLSKEEEKKLVENIIYCHVKPKSMLLLDHRFLFVLPLKL